MEKVSLTIEQFLALYTGVLLPKQSPAEITDAIEKIFKVSPCSSQSLKYAEVFRSYTKRMRIFLSKAVENIGGAFKPTEGDIDKQLEKYLDDFRCEIAGDSVTVDILADFESERLDTLNVDDEKEAE